MAALRRGLLSTVLLLSAACSGAPTASDPFTVQVTGTSSSSNREIQQPIVSPRAGTVVVTLTWPNASVDLDLILTSASCTSLSSSCQYLDSSAASSGVSERVTGSVNAGGPQLKAWVYYYFGTQPQNYTMTIDVR